ncbi:MAG: hypothetical protein WC748_01610 [Legionellales bacterium]
MFIEFRRYILKGDMLPDWVRVMEDKIFPFIKQHDMNVLASFVCPYDKSQYLWLRQFENDKERVKQYKAVYESEFWGTQIIPNADKMLEWEGIKVINIVPDPVQNLKLLFSPEDFIEFRRIKGKAGKLPEIKNYINGIWQNEMAEKDIIIKAVFTVMQFPDDYLIMLQYQDPEKQKITATLKHDAIADTYLEIPLLKSAGYDHYSG